MMKQIWLAIFVLVRFAAPAVAQKISGESEVGTDGKRETFVSQYLNLDGKHWNVLARYFGVHEVLRRGEIAIGPSFNLNPGVIKLQVGYTTDREVMAAGLLVVRVAKDRDLVYIADGKFPTASGTWSLYQKAFLPWIRFSDTRELLLRGEDLIVGGSESFRRVGVEFRAYGVARTVHGYFAPFLDFVRARPGAQIGFRF